MHGTALCDVGAQIALVTSSDENFPPENVLDGRTDTFWASTGLFPQELVVSFHDEMRLKSVHLSCCNVKKLALYASVGREPTNFEKIAEKDLEPSEGRLQTEKILFGDRPTAQHLRLVILSGHDHFVSVHCLNVDSD